MKNTKQLQDIRGAFEVLGNPLKLQIFISILSEGCECNFDDSEGIEANCVKGIMEALDLPQSTVSTYIKELSNAGLIECQKKGRIVYCRPSREGLAKVKGFIDGALAHIKFKG